MESTILRLVAVLHRHAHLPRGAMERVRLTRFRVSAPIQWEDVVRRDRRMCVVMARIRACCSCGVVSPAAEQRTTAPNAPRYVVLHGSPRGQKPAGACERATDSASSCEPGRTALTAAVSS